MPLTFCGHVLVTACAPVTALNCGIPAAVKIAAETEASLEIALESAAMEVAVDAASAPLTMALLRLLMALWMPFTEAPAALREETAQITADRAVSMLAASALMEVLITRSALKASALMTAETEASFRIASVMAAIEPLVEALA